MDTLIILVIILFGVSTVAANSGIPFAHEILSESSKYIIPSSLALAQVEQESEFDPMARGTAGEIGLMQIRQIALDEVNMELGTHYSLTELFDPAINTKIGFKYLDILRSRFGSLYNAYRAYNTGNIVSAQGKKYADSIFEKAKEY